MRDAIAELETWKSKHKARSCSIHIDDGYGASCWVVELKGENKGEVHAAEVNFFLGTPTKNTIFVHFEKLDGTMVKSDGNIISDEDNDWPGLAATILAAIDHWNSGNTQP